VTEEFLESDQMPCSIPIAQNSTNSRPRKRRLSDADTTRLPKRPRASMAGPLHAVSDPLPLATPESELSIDEWFKTNFDALFALPPPVDVTEPDHSTQWEVELFNNYIIPEDPRKSLTPCESVASFRRAVINVRNLLAIQDNRVSASTDLIALDDPLQSLESGGFVALPEITHPPTMAPFPASHGLPPLPDLSQFIDWTALLNEDPSEPTSDPLFCQSYLDSALPELDFSTLQLPQVWTAVAS